MITEMVKEKLEILKSMVSEFNNIETGNQQTQLDRIKNMLEEIDDSLLKGRLFEEFIAFLYEGKDTTAIVTGKPGDGGADVLLFNKKDMDIPILIIQAKNWKSPLGTNEIRSEIIKFEMESKKKYRCKHFAIISINGFVSTIHNNVSFEEYVRLDSWDYICNLIRNHNGNVVCMSPSKVLSSYNYMVYKNIKENLKSESKTAVIQATGTGKSYIMAQMMFDYFDKSKVVITPKNYLIEAFIRDNPGCTRLTNFMTYHKLYKMSDKELESLNPSLIIFDECHHMGADKWQKACESLILMNRDAKVLGFSATPIRYFDGFRDIVEEFFNNNKSSELTLFDAIAKEILPIPIYVTSLYTIDNEIAKYMRKVEESSNSPSKKIELIKILNEVRNNYAISKLINDYLPKQKENQKFIIFCEGRAHLEQMEYTVKEWFREAFGYGYKINTFTVSYTEPHNKDTLQKYEENNKNKHIDLLFCIDMLNEGLHIKGVRGVFLLRRTMSPNIYYQQIGRVLAIGNESPLIFDLVNNLDNVLSESFLFAIKSSKEKENQRRKLLDIPSVEFQVSSFNCLDNIKLIFTEVDKITKTKSSWYCMYEKLEEYYAEHKNSKVPKSYHDKKLVNWVILQRKYHKKGSLSDEKKALLDKLDFFWGTTRIGFNQWIKLLTDYKEKYGNLEVPNDYKVNNYNLGNFVRNLRASYKRGKVKNKEKIILDKLGFQWQLRNTGERRYNFNEYYEEIIIFYNKYHHFYPNNRYIVRDGMKLGKWVSDIRQYYKNKNGDLSSDQMKKLVAIQFPFESNDEFYWNARYKELISYKETYGDCNVDLNTVGIVYENGFKDESLGKWVDRQRTQYKKGNLSKERTEKLDIIGFQWEYNKKWEEGFKKFLEYVEQTGNPNPQRDANDGANGSIINWLFNQTQSYKKGKLDLYQIKKMEELGVVWYRRKVNIQDKLPTQNWLLKFEKFKLLYEKFKKNSEDGNTLESVFSKNKKIYNWYKRQCYNYHNGKLNIKKIELFSSIGCNLNDIK